MRRTSARLPRRLQLEVRVSCVRPPHRHACPRVGATPGARSAILVGVDIIYELGRGIADSDRADAIAHGQQVIDFERSTHTFFEPGLQAFFLPAHWLIDLANQLYLNAQFSIALGFLVWLYLFRNESYYFVRNMFVVSMCLALIGYIGFPTAPPRMFPEHGFVDTITDFSNVNHDSALAKIFINPYAAVPSMHCAFALMIGGSGVDGLPPLVGESLVGLLADPDRLGRDRHRQPLLGRRALGWMVALAAVADRPGGAGPLVSPRPGPGGQARPRGRGLAGTGSRPRSGRPPRPPRDPLASRSMESSAPPRAPGGDATAARPPRNGQELRSYARDRLIESRLTPNAISMVGLFGNLVAAVLVTQRLFFLAGVAFILGSVMDTLDGRYSRMSGKGTLFGAFLDSTLDRIEEGIVLAAVAGYFASRGEDFAAAMCVVAVLGSLMVSYTRARAEALGVECKVGLATRPVRVVLLSIGLIFAKGAGIGDFELLAPAIYVIAALTIFTVFQRVWHVRNELSERGLRRRGRGDEARGSVTSEAAGCLHPLSAIQEDFELHE